MNTIFVFFGVIVGCKPDLSGSSGQLCSVTHRTPLNETVDWTGPNEQNVLETIDTQVPTRVDWDLLTLNTASSSLEIGVVRTDEGPEIVERDCIDAPVFLRLPITADINLSEGAVTGVLKGELWAEPDGTLTIYLDGLVDVVDPWLSLGEAYVAERHGEGTIQSWDIAVRGPWTAGDLLIEVRGSDTDSNFLSSLWRGHWVINGSP